MEGQVQMGETIYQEGVKRSNIYSMPIFLYLIALMIGVFFIVGGTKNIYLLLAILPVMIFGLNPSKSFINRLVSELNRRGLDGPTRKINGITITSRNSYSRPNEGYY